MGVHSFTDADFTQSVVGWHIFVRLITALEYNPTFVLCCPIEMLRKEEPALMSMEVFAGSGLWRSRNPILVGD